MTGPKWIDLHMHSTFSDGTATPSQLVDLARATGTAAIALTDHDTADGVPELLEAGRRKGIETLAGIELSVESPCGGSVHLLGYGIDPFFHPLREALDRVLRGREERNEKIVRRLQMLGVRLNMDEVRAVAGEDVVGRPHIAQILIEKGAVETFEEAFDRYLARSGAAYYDRYRLDAQTAIGLLDAAGGLAVLAHPHLSHLDSMEEVEAVIRPLMDAGLRGLEAYYSEHTDEQTQMYLEVAAHFGLLATGGSDFHGLVRPGVMLGRGHGDLRVPYRHFERLKEAIEKK